MKMPVLFVGHGSPMNAIEDNEFTRMWKEVGKKLPKPKGILAISAHWVNNGTKISDTLTPKQIYDMYGFPKELYDLKYPLVGDMELVDAVQKALGYRVSIDNTWGIDHGAWSVLNRMFPEGNIPVLQLSIEKDAQPTKMFGIGSRLKSLRDQGILILASGNIVHNFHTIDWNMEDGYPWAKEFDDYIRDNILKKDFDAVINYEKLNISSAFYTPEHFEPLLYALGAVEKTDDIEVFNNKCIMGSLSMTSYIFNTK